MQKSNRLRALAILGAFVLSAAHAIAAEPTQTKEVALVKANRIEVRVCVVPEVKWVCRTAELTTGGEKFVAEVGGKRRADFEDFIQTTGSSYHVKAQVVGSYDGSGQVMVQLAARLSDPVAVSTLAQQLPGPTSRVSSLEDAVLITRGETIKRYVGEKLMIQLEWKEGQSQ